MYREGVANQSTLTFASINYSNQYGAKQVYYLCPVDKKTELQPRTTVY